MFRRLTALAALLIASSAAVAGTAIDAANNQVRLTGVHQNFDYYEYDDYKLTKNWWLDSETGYQSGVSGGLTLQGDLGTVSNVYFDAEVTRITGNTRYNGYLQGGATLIPYQSNTDYTTTDYQFKLGKGITFAGSSRFQLTPYASFGAYNWLRDSSADQYGYAERYKHKFFAVGAMAQYELTPTVVIKADVMQGLTTSPEMTLVADGTLFKLGSKPISQVSVGVDYAMTPQLHLRADYRMTKFSYGESSVIGGFLEPRSKTDRQQLFIGLGYSFN